MVSFHLGGFTERSFVRIVCDDVGCSVSQKLLNMLWFGFYCRKCLVVTLSNERSVLTVDKVQVIGLPLALKPLYLSITLLLEQLECWEGLMGLRFSLFRIVLMLLEGDLGGLGRFIENYYFWIKYSVGVAFDVFVLLLGFWNYVEALVDQRRLV